MTPKTALLHIGTSKTGTTSIQESLAHAETQGALSPCRYPLWRLDRNHNRLTTLYLPYRDLPQIWHARYPHDDNRFSLARRRYRRFLFRALQSSQGAILSGESLSNYFSASVAGRFREDLESLGFGKFHIVLYIRDPADFYLSRTQQVLKWSFYPTTVVADPVSFRYQFRRMAETWEQVFPGSVIVRRFPGGWQGDVIDDFTGLLGEHLGITLPRAADRLNTTVSAEAMAVLQDYRQATGPDEDGLLIPGLDRLVAFLAQSGQRISQTRPALKAAVAQQIRDNHRQDAEFINFRYGVDLGLGRAGGAAPMAARASWRVEDILESVDHEVVRRLEGEFARLGPVRNGSLPVRVAVRAYRAIPPQRRPAHLDAWLRAKTGRGPQA